MKFRILFSLIILISIGFLNSCNDDGNSTEELIKTPPNAIFEVDPYQGYYGLNTSFTITSFLYDENTSESDLRLNWFTNNKHCGMCELEEYTNRSSFSIKFENSEVDEDKRIDLILFVTNEFGLNDSTSHTFIFENETPVIDFKISPDSGTGTNLTPFTFDLSNSTNAFGGKDLFLKLDKNGNGSWDYERAYENESSFIITTSGFPQNETTKVKVQIEDSRGNKATEIKSIRLEHGIIIISG
ncbi:hypothetical protein [Ekhidna sp.]|uniref:hypothetical protein n=1 Tax=Ekhidna sp. TaxID=2608089 RepID=UPI003B50652F